MTSKLTREKAQWLHGACEEAAAAGIKLTMNPNELLMFTSYALAAMDSEPVAYTDEEELNFVNDMACMWTKGMGINEVPLYRHAQPAPVVPEVINKLLAILDRHTVQLGWGEKPITLAELVITRDGSDELEACRAAMLAAAPQEVKS